MGKGRLVAQSFGIVSRGDEERRGGVGSDAERGHQFGRGLFDQGLEDGVDLGDLLFEGDGSPGQHPQAELGERDDVAFGSGPIGRGPLEKVEDVEASELVSDGLGGSRDQVAHLVERLGPTLPRRCSGNAQNPHGFDVSVPRLGLAAGVAREGGPGGRDGIFGIGLALAPAALAIGAVHLDDADPFVLKVTGEPGAIRAGPFDTDQLDGAEVAQPPQQLLVAGSVVGKLSTPRRAPRSSKAAATCTSRCVSTPPVMLRAKLVTVIPSLDWVGGDTAPSGTTDRTATGLCEAGSY